MAVTITIIYGTAIKRLQYHWKAEWHPWTSFCWSHTIRLSRVFKVLDTFPCYTVWYGFWPNNDGMQAFEYHTIWYNIDNSQIQGYGKIVIQVHSRALHQYMPIYTNIRYQFCLPVFCIHEDPEGESRLPEQSREDDEDEHGLDEHVLAPGAHHHERLSLWESRDSRQLGSRDSFYLFSRREVFSSHVFFLS